MERFFLVARSGAGFRAWGSRVVRRTCRGFGTFTPKILLSSCVLCDDALGGYADPGTSACCHRLVLLLSLTPVSSLLELVLHHLLCG